MSRKVFETEKDEAKFRKNYSGTSNPTEVIKKEKEKHQRREKEDNQWGVR